MLVPHGKQAIVDIRKLRDYCLNPDNPPRCSQSPRLDRKTLTWYILSAKQEETRLKRLAILIDASAKFQRLK